MPGGDFLAGRQHLWRRRTSLSTRGRSWSRCVTPSTRDCTTGAGGPGLAALGLRAPKGGSGSGPTLLRRWIRNPSLIAVCYETVGIQGFALPYISALISHQLCKLFGMLNCPFGEVRNSFPESCRANVYYLLVNFLFVVLMPNSSYFSPVFHCLLPQIKVT